MNYLGNVPTPLYQNRIFKLVQIYGSSYKIVNCGITGVGIDVNRFHVVHQQNFKDYGYIWRFMVPGLPAIVNTARPEDSEKYFEMHI